MNNFLLFIIIYISLLIVWFTINIVFYFLSVLLKKKTLTDLLARLSIIALYIVNTLIGFYLVFLMITFFLSGQWLFFVLLFFFGVGLISGLASFIQIPFVVISNYFAEKFESIDFDENIERAEILDEKNKVVDILEGETVIKTKLAKWFIALYGLGVISLIISPIERKGLMGGGFITKPFFQIISTTLIIGLPYGIYRLIRYRNFFPNDKRYFLIETWKISVYLTLFLMILIFLLTINSN
jgi:hypothetical protein